MGAKRDRPGPHRPTTGEAAIRRSGARSRAPWHLWPVAGVMLLLAGGGLWDYLNLIEPNTAYIEDQGWGASGIAYFTDYPIVLRLPWTTALVGATAAPVLALFRSRLAVPLALLAAISQVLLLVSTLAFMDRLAALGTFTAFFDFGVAVVFAAFWGYCRCLRARSALR
ncbi:hypothetical protein [Streptomonospora wellingtoniae]|uniref:Uncharacterized protein n=1 Tax=Streptomonospora wellingtoniae TaxID=3075544 RepID=A0ABU2KY96_9ACTN|nr:hypothetical protein [Streptomonospora sp. DSM 45055]MDT0304270.1 hypothetical protein [Streptomonospora sp. DSM 45055]